MILVFLRNLLPCGYLTAAGLQQQEFGLLKRERKLTHYCYIRRWHNFYGSLASNVHPSLISPIFFNWFFLSSFYWSSFVRMKVWKVISTWFCNAALAAFQEACIQFYSMLIHILLDRIIQLSCILAQTLFLTYRITMSPSSWSNNDIHSALKREKRKNFKKKSDISNWLKTLIFFL